MTHTNTTPPRGKSAPTKLPDILPSQKRRTEANHPDGHAAVLAHGCPKCKARKGTLCFKGDGTRTLFVHAARLQKWEDQS